MEVRPQKFFQLTLHHVHNSVKRAFLSVFGDLDALLKCIKYDIRSSPKKIEIYLETCARVGELKAMLVSYCSSRFLDKYQSVNDVLKHMETLVEFYSRTDEPKKRNTVLLSLSFFLPAFTSAWKFLSAGEAENFF